MLEKCTKCVKQYCLCRSCPNSDSCKHALKRKCKGVEYCSIYRRLKEENQNVGEKIYYGRERNS